MPDQPRILYIIGQLGRGGAEQQFYYLLKYLRPQAHVIVLTKGGYWVEPIRELGIPVLELERQGRADLGRLFAIMREIRRYQPMIVHLFTDNLYGLYGRLAAILTGQRYVIVGERAHPTFDPAWYIALRRWVLNRFIAYSVANSKAAQTYIVEQMRFPQARAYYIPNGLEIDRIQQEAIAGDFPLPADWHDKLVIGTVGSLSARKAPELFIKVAAELLAVHPDLRFVWVGEGELRPQVEAQIDALQLGGKVLLAGQRLDVPRWLAAMHIFMLTSKLEGTPNAIMEAMVVGLPVVSTAVDGCVELVREGETGYLAPTGDVTALANRALQLIEDEGLRHRLGEQARATIQAYDVQAMADQYGQVYTQLVRDDNVDRDSVENA